MSLVLSLALYNGALVGAGLLGLPLWALWVLRSPRLRRGFAERLRPLARADGPTIWVHAASVGEVEAAAPLIERLLRDGARLRLTAQSDTGRERLRRHFPELEPRLAPLDLPWLARASARRARVAALVLIETELWPNTIVAVRRGGGAVLIASGRISDRSFPRYRAARGLLRGLLGELDAIAARTEVDRQRFLVLGAGASRVRVLGDVKLARAPARAASESLRSAVGPTPWLLGASTHPGEEDALVDALLELRPSLPELRLVLAPRHPERAGEVVEQVAARGLSVGRRSEGAADRAVVVVDSLGELASLYGLADLVFSGGTLAPVGGHNLYEAVSAGRVVVVGPHTENQRAQVDALEGSGALVRIDGVEALTPTLARLLECPDRHAPARAAWAKLAGDGRPVEGVLGWLESLGATARARR